MSADSLSVADGVISAANGRTVSYGELAASLDLKREATATVRPKPAGLHKIVGQSIPRFDIPGKVTGKAMYVQDLRLPGMVHGRVVRPPRYGATLESVDDAKARAIPGVIAVVRDGSFLGVIAEREEQAVKARAALADGGEMEGRAGAARPGAHLRAPEVASHQGRDHRRQAGAAARAARRRCWRRPTPSPTWRTPRSGPSAAVAEFKDGKFTVWTHSQGVFPLRAELAKALKMPPAAVRCIHTEGSGCYGHNGADDVALDAALLARARAGQAGAAAMDARRRVRLGALWARDGDAGARRARRRGAHRRLELRAVEQHALDAPACRPPARTCSPPGIWPSRSRWAPPTSPPQPAGGGDRNAIPLYDFPNQKVVHHFIQEMPIRVSALRDARRLRQRVRGGILHGRAGARGRRRSGRVPPGAPEGPAREGRDREGRRSSPAGRPGEKGDGARGRGIGFAKYKNLACYCAVIADVEVDRASGARARRRAPMRRPMPG